MKVVPGKLGIPQFCIVIERSDGGIRVFNSVIKMRVQDMDFAIFARYASAFSSIVFRGEKYWIDAAKTIASNF
jgi:hypothetical protein